MAVRTPAVGKKKLSDIIHLRSLGKSGAEVASRLGIWPWHVYYVSQVIKVVVGTEELQWIEEEKDRHGFATVGEFVMDVFNRCYEEYYLPAVADLSGHKKGKREGARKKKVA